MAGGAAAGAAGAGAGAGPPARGRLGWSGAFAAGGRGRGGLGNFLKGVRWAPGGGALLAASDDGCLRVFPVGEEGGGGALAPGAGGGEVWDGVAPALEVAPGGAVNDYAWFPGASFLAGGCPSRRCFFSTASGGPAHLWDAGSGALRAAYRAQCTDLDEIMPAFSLAVRPDGAVLALGFARGELRLFDVGRPGSDDCFRVPRARRGAAAAAAAGPALRGIVSSLCFSPTDPRGVFAAGSYDGQAALYDPGSGSQAVVLLRGGHGGAGVSQVLWSRDGNYLYTGARREGSVVCWDARRPDHAVYALGRDAAGTNQRLQFDIEPCGRRLATGGEDGRVRLFDLSDGRPVAAWVAAADAVNGCHFHPSLPALATSSGARVFPDVGGSDSEDEGGREGEGRVADGHPRERNCLRVWSLRSGLSGLEAEGAAAEPEPRLAPARMKGMMWGLSPIAAAKAHAAA